MDLSYFWYEAAHAFMSPARAATDATKLLFNNPVNPLTYTSYGRTVSAGCELFERTTRRYGKPSFGLPTTVVDGELVQVQERIVWERPFGRVIAFDRAFKGAVEHQPKVLMVAPMSGHFATLLRGTVETFLPNHQVFITDWTDARMVPLAEGGFDLDDYVDYLIDIFRALGPDLHVMAVCQPSVPAIMAVARMEADGDPATPRSLTMMGGPVDTRRSPTQVNELAERRGVDWFKSHCIVKVPPPNPGFWRDVYPGYMQLSGFMSMNMDRHLTAHWDMFQHLVQRDGDSAEKHREFYDEYLAVMDLTAEFYLQTVQKVFVDHDLPKGEMMHRDRPVDLMAIRKCALMAVEGENDDISGVGQTLAALELTPNLAPDKKLYHLQEKVGHYGVFNGKRFRAEIAPRISRFMRDAEAVKTRPARRLQLVG
jgi:poly(3-hydroxybutyrate) depolymerase